MKKARKLLSKSIALVGAVITLTSFANLPDNAVSVWNTPTLHCWTTANGLTHCQPRASVSGPIIGDSWNTPTSHCWINRSGAQACVPRSYPDPVPPVINSWNTPTMHCWTNGDNTTHCQPRRW